MKLVNYQLQNQIELLTEQKSNNHFKEYLKTILEDDTKPYYSKADYLGLSLNELKSKIDYLSQDIRDLQAYKKKLSSALDIARIETAKVFIDNGITRIDGNIISSITLSKPSSKTKENLTILDEQEVMRLGYVKFMPDTESILQAMKTAQGKDELDKFVEIQSQTINTPAKVKINTKRSVNNTIISTDELLHLKQVA
jgi:hypothetical protein